MLTKFICKINFHGSRKILEKFSVAQIFLIRNRENSIRSNFVTFAA